MWKSKSTIIILAIVILTAGVWWLPEKKKSAQPLFYAIKEGKHSTVYSKDAVTGITRKIWEFEEPITATLSGNYWEGLPPNVALSPDKNSLAYIDISGLSLVDLETSKTRSLVQFLGSNHDIAKPVLKWNPSMPGVSVLAQPSWSVDGQSLFFRQGHYEGSSEAEINIKDGTLRQVEENMTRSQHLNCLEAGIIVASDHFCIFLGS